jgi:hypothetical protein
MNGLIQKYLTLSIIKVACGCKLPFFRTTDCDVQIKKQIRSETENYTTSVIRPFMQALSKLWDFLEIVVIASKSIFTPRLDASALSRKKNPDPSYLDNLNDTGTTQGCKLSPPQLPQMPGQWLDVSEPST